MLLVNEGVVQEVLQNREWIVWEVLRGVDRPLPDTRIFDFIVTV